MVYKFVFFYWRRNGYGVIEVFEYYGRMNDIVNYNLLIKVTDEENL